MSQKSFTTRKNRIDFDIDGEMFYLLPGIAAGDMFEISNLQAKMQAAAGDLNSHMGHVLMKELSKIFEPESFTRFEVRFWGKDAEGNRHPQPVDLDTFNKLVEWVLGEALGKEITPS
jgi:hypothetical protein